MNGLHALLQEGTLKVSLRGSLGGDSEVDLMCYRLLHGHLASFNTIREKRMELFHIAKIWHKIANDESNDSPYEQQVRWSNALLSTVSANERSRILLRFPWHAMHVYLASNGNVIDRSIVLNIQELEELERVDMTTIEFLGESDRNALDWVSKWTEKRDDAVFLTKTLEQFYPFGSFLATRWYLEWHEANQHWLAAHTN